MVENLWQYRRRPNNGNGTHQQKLLQKIRHYETCYRCVVVPTPASSQVCDPPQRGRHHGHAKWEHPEFITTSGREHLCFIDSLPASQSGKASQWQQTEPMHMTDVQGLCLNREGNSTLHPGGRRHLRKAWHPPLSTHTLWLTRPQTHASESSQQGIVAH